MSDSADQGAPGGPGTPVDPGVSEGRSGPGRADRRWPRWVYGVGDEPDARFSFANERTFLAWIRTGLGFVTAAVAVFALVALRPELEDEARVASLVLAITGVACGVSAIVGWARNERQLRQSKPLPSSPLMPLLVVVLVIVALIAVLLLLP